MRILFLTIISFCLVACAGQTQDQDGGDLTRGEVEFLASKMQAAVEAEFPLLKHKLVTRYVNSLGQSIVSRNKDFPPLPYEFRVLRSNEILVFSLPGGLVYITLGTLRAVELEGQLAAALSHELAHQQLNHPLIYWRRKVNANRGQQNLLDFSGDWKESFLARGGALHFGKAMEQEADALAPVIMYRSKFEPRVYSSYLQLLKNKEFKSRADVAALLSFHPPLTERLAWTKENLSKIPPLKDPVVSSPTFDQIKAILREAEKSKTKKSATSETTE